MARTPFQMWEENVQWMNEGNCSGLASKEGNYDTFFPEDNVVGQKDPTARAKAICADCPVRMDCLDYAIRNHVNYGVWGGMSTKQRTQVARQRRREAKFLVEQSQTAVSEIASLVGDTPHLFDAPRYQ